MSREPAEELEQRLFDAGRSERPSSDARERAVELLLRARPVRRRFPLRVTWALFAAAFVGVLTPLWLRSREPLIGAERLPANGRVVAPQASATGRSNATGVPASAAPVQPEAQTAVTTRREPAVPAAPASAPLRTLADETAALARVEQALRAGKPAAALALLERYGRGAPSGSLAAEAGLLRIQALSQAGNAAAAGELARKFVSSYPNSPLVDRAREYLPATARDGGETDGTMVDKTGGVQ